MPIQIQAQDLQALQSKPLNIRNLCIIAHVDHGKTSLADNLLSSNGIISSKLAGQIRFLDSTEEEQTRGITMQSSAISLLYKAINSSTEDSYLINLIDSPGHVDFSGDVSSACRICDGALVLIDVVEGVCAQSHAVLRQALKERVKPCLILNKIDRLILELRFSPTEAYQHICRIIEQVNVIMSSMFTGDALMKDQSGESWGNENETNESLFFSPEKGNVVFASAVDGWAFGLGYFAQKFAQKLDLPMAKLRRCLWGEYYFNPKTKSVQKKPYSSSAVPMFVQMVLEPIWDVYQAVHQSNDGRLQQILRSLKLRKTLTDRELNHSNPTIVLQNIMRHWLPLSSAVLRMVVRTLPNPIEAQKVRIHQLLPPSTLSSCPTIFKSISTCDSLGPVVVHVSKVTSIEKTLLSDGHLYSSSSTAEDDADEEILIAYCRVFSGELRKDMPLYVLSAMHNHDQPDASHYQAIPPGNIRPYMIMGREMVALESVPAGNVVGIVGLGDSILKTATISSVLECPSLTKMTYQAKPIVRVAIEPKDPRDFPIVERGLQLLNRADPAVEVFVQETGEHVLVALGELHLERCIADLSRRFAQKVSLSISEPIVSFRETILDDAFASNHAQRNHQSKMQQIRRGMNVVAKGEMIEATTAGGSIRIKIQARALSKELALAIEGQNEALRRWDSDQPLSLDTREILWPLFCQYLQDHLGFPADRPMEHAIWSLGPRRIGPNVLINRVPGFIPSQRVFELDEPREEETKNVLFQRLENSILTGFQASTAAGPMCDEPMWGVAFILESIENLNEEAEEESKAKKEEEAAKVDSYGPVTGQLISTMKRACTEAFLLRSSRLVEAIYLCTLQCPSEQLGKAYSVLGRRRGTILAEELSDGTTLFEVEAWLPVVESFGFASELLSITSGQATSPQLVFSHFEMIATDPYFEATTEDEKIEHGEMIVHEKKNFVREYIDQVRKRKGLSLEDKLVKHAEKQRTLTRNK